MNIFWGIVVLIGFWLAWRYRYKWQTNLNHLFGDTRLPKDKRIIAKTRVNGYLVSTVRLPYAELGIIDSDIDSYPFETQVFLPSGHSVDELRYSNELQAIAGHKNFVGKYTFKPTASSVSTEEFESG